MTNLFGHSVRSELLFLYVVETLACFLAFYLILAWGLEGVPGLVPGALALLAGTLAASAGLISGASGLYEPDSWQRVRRLLLGVGVACLFLMLLAQLLSPALLPVSAGWRGQIELLLAFAAALLVSRVGLLAVTRAGLLRRRIIHVVGGQDTVRQLRPDPFFEVALSIPQGTDLAAALAPAQLAAIRPWAVVAADSAAMPAASRQALRAAGVALLDEAEFAEKRLGRVDLARLQPGWLEAARISRPGPVEQGLRRAFDIALSLVLLLATLPVLAVAAAAIKLDSRGPVFYRQERVGLGGRVYTLFKFRSMVDRAEEKGGPAWAQKHDKRITRVGRFLRLTRIDEIPQVFNVLKGDMAFVGPRPERPEFVAQLVDQIPHYRDREVVKPGITGWAQVNYPYGASVEDSRNKLAYDLYYVRRRSLFLDLLILVATVRVVLFQEGSR
jgi:lipopolysaccharide/colanic/teichoic acid biosynthesis glycosyltransferase